jgi:hypothetical protein
MGCIFKGNFFEMYLESFSNHKDNFPAYIAGLYSLYFLLNPVNQMPVLEYFGVFASESSEQT